MAARPGERASPPALTAGVRMPSDSRLADAVLAALVVAALVGTAAAAAVVASAPQPGPVADGAGGLISPKRAGVSVLESGGVWGCGGAVGAAAGVAAGVWRYTRPDDPGRPPGRL